MPLDPLSVPFLRSCERCRGKKRRCSGDKPACAWCRDHGIPCRYRRSMRFNRQLKDAYPPRSIAELAVPVVLAQQGTLRREPPPPPAAGESTGLSVDGLARLFSVDMVPVANPPARDVLLTANSFMSPFQLPVLPSAPDWPAMASADASVLANLGDLAAAAARLALPQPDWVPLGLADGAAGGIDLEGFQLPLLGGEEVLAIGVDPALDAQLDRVVMPATAGAAGSPSDTLDDSDSAVPPPLLREYVARIPGSPPPEAVYTIMRATFRAPRMGMVALNLELLWYMLHKGILPRIAFYGHIASTIRCSSSGVDIQSMVPPNIDESCYELALQEVPLVRDSAAVWAAIGLCMVARYEFQSARYNEMAEHADMALGIMHRVQFGGFRFPWHNAAASAKEGFEFQYLLAIYWKCFLWRTVTLLLLEKGPAMESALDHLPDYSSTTFDLYACDVPYNVDLEALLPPGSWPAATPGTPHIRFCGPSDPEFMRLRPAGSPAFGRISISGAYLQQQLVIQMQFLALQHRARQGQAGVGALLKALRELRERMEAWRRSLPPELVLDHQMVADYLAAIGPASTATADEIDLKALRLKAVLALFLAYHTGLVRANRFTMKAMLGERLDVPPPDVTTMGFAIRDLYESQTAPPAVMAELGAMNMRFHGCRIQATRSANALCSIMQAAHACRFNFYTLGVQVVFATYEVVTVCFSFLGNCDEALAWQAKSRLANAFNILRILRHWAPALHIFVAGFRALSDPRFCLNKPQGPAVAVHETPPHKRSHTVSSLSPPPSHVRRDETLGYGAADPVPEFPNPFPQNHVITQILDDLGLSLAEFLAPSFPILLLKLLPQQP